MLFGVDYRNRQKLCGCHGSLVNMGDLESLRDFSKNHWTQTTFTYGDMYLGDLGGYDLSPKTFKCSKSLSCGLFLK
jgi:hypothetical protein